MSELELYMYMSFGELLDVVNFATPSERWRLNDPRYEWFNDHCSGAVTVSDDAVYVG